MKYIILCLLLSFSILAEGEKVKYKEGEFELSKALAGSGMSSLEFFTEFKKIASHNFKKDKRNINYIMLNDFLEGIQDKKKDEEIIISVNPQKDYNKIKFHMYVKPSPEKKAKHHVVEMNYSQDTSKKNIVESTITFEYNGLTRAAVKGLSAFGLLSFAVPIKEKIKMIYHPQKDIITYFVSMTLMAPIDSEELDKAFDDAFEKIQKIAADKVIPVIQERLY